MKIEIFTSGRSGDRVGVPADSLLDRLERNLPGLETAGITVQFYGLDSDPVVFALHAGIADLLHSEGIGVLPATFIDGKLIAKGRYLLYEELVREAAVRGVPIGR